MAPASTLYNPHPDTIVMYSTAWCPDCRRTRRIFAQAGVAYTDVDIDKDPQAEQFVRQMNRGNRSVPTILFPDGSRLVEPADAQLLSKLREYQKA